MPPLDLERAILELLGQKKLKVPPYPAVAFRVEALVRGGTYGLEELSRLVSSDQVLAADVLRCANCALYARGAPVASLKQAVGRIGARDVARLALASGLGAHALAVGRLAALRRRAWLDALASGVLCQGLARARKFSPDVAFAAGLLHDFGKVVAIACVEELLQRHEVVPARPEEEWNTLVERFHVDMGVVMASRWDLPPVLTEAISLHHSGDAAAAAEPQLLKIVTAVDQVVEALASQPRLGPEEMATLPAVAPPERDGLVLAAEALPAFVSSFESGEAWKGDEGESLVAPPLRPVPAAEAPAHKVILRLGKREQSYALAGVEAGRCLVTGPSAMPANLLLELRVESQPPLRGHALVRAAWHDAGGWTLAVQPWALTEGARQAWRALAPAPAAG